jgi:hypothetical protein
LLEKYYESQDSMEELPSSAQLGNIYYNALNAAEDEDFASAKLSVDAVAEFIKTQYQCEDITTTDIYNVF